MVGVEDEGPLVRALLADTEVVRDGGAVVGAADPLVAGAELESGCLGGLPDRVQGGEEGGGVHAVARGVGGGHLDMSPWMWVAWWLC